MILFTTAKGAILLWANVEPVFAVPMPVFELLIAMLVVAVLHEIFAFAA